MSVLPTDTRYLAAVVRIRLLAPDAKSAAPMPPMRWEPKSLERLTAQYERESKKFASWKGMMGPRGQVDEKTRHIAAAAAWGLFPERDATYLNYAGGHDASACPVATYPVPDYGAFWSITVYGRDGYMKSPNSVLNGLNVKPDADGRFTARFGSKDACGDAPNRLYAPEGWNC